LAARKKASELKQTLQSPLIKASELKQTLQSPLIKDERVVSFYQTTRDAWLDGKLSSLGNGFKNEGLLEQEDFIKKYPPIEGSALGVFFEKFQTLKGEFMVGIGNLKTTNNSGWFVLTNLRLIQRDGRNDEFKEVILADVDSYQINGVNTKTLVFKMKSGGDITFEKVQMYPNDKFLSTLIAQRIEA
jgi:hypothetical protein